MSRTHSSETSLSCERSSNRIVSGFPFKCSSPWSPTSRWIASGC